MIRKPERRKPKMEDLVNLIVNSGVTVVIIAYFMFRDYKFMNQLQNTLTTLVDTVSALKDVLRFDEKED